MLAPSRQPTPPPPRPPPPLPQTFVFAVPLPLRDRQLRVELYRTASNTQRGRLISMANVRASPGHGLRGAGGPLGRQRNMCRRAAMLSQCQPLPTT